MPAAGRARPGRAAFFASHNLANALNYAFLLLMSQALAPEAFSLFAALFALIYLASALANTVQVSVAAEVAAGEAGDAVVALVVRYLIALLVPFALIALVVAWPIGRFLHSTDVAAVLIALASIWVFLLAAVGYGGLQGRDRFFLLSLGLLVAALGRVLLGGAFVWLGLGPRGALLGVLLGLALSAVLVLSPYARRVLRPARASLPTSRLVASALVASVAIAIPTSGDVLLARHYLPASEAGAYAAVSVLGKILILGPMAIALASFPSFVKGAAHARPLVAELAAALGGTATVSSILAVAVIAGGALAPDLLLRGYDVPAPLLSSYVVAMGLFSVTVTLMYFLLARRRFASLVAVPLVLVAELVLIGLWHPSGLSMSLVLLLGNAALCAFALAASWRACESEAARQPAYSTTTAMVSQTDASPTVL